MSANLSTFSIQLLLDLLPAHKAFASVGKDKVVLVALLGPDPIVLWPGVLPEDCAFVGRHLPRHEVGLSGRPLGLARTLVNFLLEGGVLPLPFALFDDDSGQPVIDLPQHFLPLRAQGQFSLQLPNFFLEVLLFLQGDFLPPEGVKIIEFGGHV